jgi:hypothetical protein
VADFPIGLAFADKLQHFGCGSVGDGVADPGQTRGVSAPEQPGDGPAGITVDWTTNDWPLKRIEKSHQLLCLPIGQAHVEALIVEIH